MLIHTKIVLIGLALSAIPSLFAYGFYPPGGTPANDLVSLIIISTTFLGIGMTITSIILLPKLKNPDKKTENV